MIVTKKKSLLLMGKFRVESLERHRTAEDDTMYSYNRFEMISSFTRSFHNMSVSNGRVKDLLNDPSRNVLFTRI